MLEVFQYKFFRRRFEIFQILAPFGKFFQQRPLLFHRQRHGVSLGKDDFLHHRLPARPDIHERRGVFLGKALDGFDRALHIGEPSEIGLVKKMVHDTGVRPVVVNAKIVQLEIFKPRQHHQPAVKYRMDVVPESRVISVFVRVQTAADFHVLLDDHDLLPALRQVSGADHAVMASADDHAVVFQDFSHAFVLLCRP